MTLRRLRSAGAWPAVQQSLREAAPEVREREAAAVHASRPAPIRLGMVLRVLGVGTAVAAFLSLLFLFNGPPQTIAIRSLLYFAYSWTGSLLGLVSVRIAARLGFWTRPVTLLGLVAGLLMAPPMAFVVWLGATLADGGPPPPSALPGMVWETALICVGASVVAVLIGRGRRAAAVAPGQPKFLERLPLRLRGGEVLAVEAEDHYLRLHTSKGQDLILFRLSDAIDELAGVEGMQVHRSWWVARDAIVDAKRGDGRATLTLKDGSEVPVSRTYARELRARGWI